MCVTTFYLYGSVYSLQTVIYRYWKVEGNLSLSRASHAFGVTTRAVHHDVHERAPRSAPRAHSAVGVSGLNRTHFTHVNFVHQSVF